MFALYVLLYIGALAIGILSTALTSHALTVLRGGAAAPDGATADVKPGFLARRTPAWLQRLLWWRRRSPRTVTMARGIAAAFIPAYNEAAVIASTLRSVLTSYYPEDIYVYCDVCSDDTAAIARKYLPAANVIEGTTRMGKSRADEYVLQHYIFPRQYTYVTILDADTLIGRDFLYHVLRRLRYRDVACVAAQIRSQWSRQSLFVMYRCYVYAIWLSMLKELQSHCGAIINASGCCTTWKTRVLQELVFDHSLGSEDMDLTLQVHRRGLGKVGYVREAVVVTQDPFSFSAFRRQNERWVLTWWETMAKHRLGLQWIKLRRGVPVGISTLDIGAALLMLDVFLVAVQVVLACVVLVHPLPLSFWWLNLHERAAALWIFATQSLIISTTALAVSIVLRRPLLVLVSPLFLPVLYLDLFIYWRGLGEALLRKAKLTPASRRGMDVSIYTSERRALE